MTPLLPPWVADAVVAVMFWSGMAVIATVSLWIAWELITAPEQDPEPARLDRMDGINSLPTTKQRGGVS